MKKRTKSLLSVILSAGLVLAACGKSDDTSGSSNDNKNNDEKTYNIGVTQIVEHPSLNEAFEGFKKALEDQGIKAKYDVQNAQGDSSANTTIANNLVSSNPDLIFANSTPSAQSVLSYTKDIPIIFTSVTDPVGAELVKAFDQPGENITGTVDSHPEAIPSTLKFIKEQLDGKRVGLLYNAGEQNSVAQVNAVKQMMKEIGLEPVEASVSTSADVKQAAESIVDKIDAFYIVTDNTVVSAIESVISVANEQDVPLLTAELDSIDKGAFAAYGFDYYDIGYEAGLMAASILKGEKKPSDIPVQYPQKLKLVINKKAAAEMGVELKPEWESIAEYVE